MVIREISPRYSLYVILLLICAPVVIAQSNTVQDVCNTPGIRPRPVEFEPGGIILTSFDSESLWVYDIDRNTRYPLPQTRPCPSNCRLSPMADWLLYMNPDTFVYEKMRVNGTDRRTLISGAADVLYWDAETFLVWTPDHRAYLVPEANISTGQDREPLSADQVLTFQPGGDYALKLLQADDGFIQTLVNLNQPADAVPLTPDTPYFNAAVWSPDGATLAYIGRGEDDASIGIAGAELYLIQPGDTEPRQLTDLTARYGAVRINGYSQNSLSWSPDGTQIAFWVIELLGADPTANTGTAMLHVIDVATGNIRRYCGYVTDEHTPTAPRIIWSPDGTHVAFGGNVPADDKGYLLLALNLANGVITELSDGIYPALGSPDVVAWGRLP